MACLIFVKMKDGILIFAKMMDMNLVFVVDLMVLNLIFVSLTDAILLFVSFMVVNLIFLDLTGMSLLLEDFMLVNLLFVTMNFAVLHLKKIGSAAGWRNFLESFSFSIWYVASCRI